MIEADPLATVQITTDATQVVLQAGPPTDLPAQVPDFVTSILDEISASMGGIGETVSELTPGGTESAARGSSAGGAAVDTMTGK